MSKKTGIWRQLEASADDIRHALGRETLPDTAVVLGSGFRGFEIRLFESSSIEFSDIRHFPLPTVAGHGGQLYVGRLGAKEICVLTGRIHMYEGHSAEDVVYPVRVLSSLGVQNLILTNAAGSVDTSIQPGQVVLLSDHINFTGKNCLVGMGNDLGNLFVDMQNAYDPEWREAVTQAVPNLVSGIYAGVLGPNYESAAETAMFGKLGANVVGMSTVQETIAARQIGMRVLGISFVTNMAGGLGGALSHEEVLSLSAEHRNRLHDVLETAATV